jgi:hypothetical protein
MKSLTLALCVTTALSTGPAAQSSQDFSGTWTMDLSRSESAAQATPSGPVTVVIRQDSDQVRIETTQKGTTQAVTYFPAAMQSASAENPVGTFRWDGSKLVTSLVTAINKQAVTYDEVRSLNSGGTEMTVALTLVVQHGYQGSRSTVAASSNSPNTATGTNVFVRAR